MFHNNLARLAVRRSRERCGERRESPRFDVPLFVRTNSGDYVQRHGRLSLNGFYFETDEFLAPGQQVHVKVVLYGLGIEVVAWGTVTNVSSANGHVGVAARFDEIPFDTERMIARWLDLMNRASENVAML